MGRKKWNSLSKEGQDKLRLIMIRTINRLVKSQENFDKEFDFFDALNDEIMDCFECNLHCDSCTEIDRANCLENFRTANIFLLKKLRFYEDHLRTYFIAVRKWSKLFFKLIFIDKTTKELEEKLDKILETGEDEEEIEKEEFEIRIPKQFKRPKWNRLKKIDDDGVYM